MFAVEVDVAQVVERQGGTMVARDVAHPGLAPPPGDELFRFATVNDTHVGLEEFGFLPTVRDAGAGSDPPSVRCLRAAVTEAVEWGAQLLVAKGDLTEDATEDEGRTAASVLASGGVPVEALVGNHEARRGHADLVRVFADVGVPLTSGGVRTVDVPGLRLVLFDSTSRGHHTGSYRQSTGDVVDAVSGTTGPAMLLTHHQPQPLPIFHHWPPGVPSPQARRFLGAVVAANPRVVMSTGHTHRHRRYERGGVVVTEIGSPQHYPGTWAGYVVHEGGIRQVVRRVAAPDALAWTEATGRSVLGVWRRWSPGRITDRCFSHTW